MNVVNYKNNLIWIDLEMTGLNPKIHRIIEIATLITDNNLSILDIGPNLVIKQKKKHLSKMNSWCLKVHNRSGLLKLVHNSVINECYAETLTLQFLQKWVKYKSSPICGNTVSQDRRFLFKYMPRLEDFFHYRYIDVSSLKELFNRWIPNFNNFFKKKKFKHSALYDIKQSVLELKYYKSFLINYK